MLAQRESSEGLSDLSAHETNFSFEAGGFQTREVKQEAKIAQIRDNFDPLKIFGKVGEYDGLPLIARNGEIIAGNHRGQAIKELSGENLARYNDYAKKVFGIDLPQDKIIVRRILDDTQSPQGANLLEQIALAARSNKGAESTLGEQATSALGTYKDKIQKELLDNPARRYIESDSVDNQMQAVANLLNAPLKAEEANLALLASLSKASHNLDIAKALDMIEGDDLLKAKIKNMLIANAGGFYNISRSIATPKLNEITNYLVDGIAYLGKASKQSGSENINRSEAYRELAQKINDRASGKVLSFSTMQTPLDEFVAQTKADVLGASLSKFANQDHASQRLYEALRDMPSILEEKFSTPSFDFFGNGGNKALKEVDMYDFLDYMIGRGQQNEATSQLKDALLELKKLESSTPPPNPNNPTPPTNPNNPTPSNPTKTNADSAAQVAQGDNAITPPASAEGDTGGGLFDMPKTNNTNKPSAKANPPQSQTSKDEVLQNLQHLPSTPLPKEVSEAEFLEQGLEKVVNKSSFLAHQKTKSDAHTRLKYLNLIKPTLENKDIALKTLGKNGEDRKAYLKVFEYGNDSDKKLFYTLITEQDDSYLITGYPISKIKEVERVIKNAQSVEYFGRPTEALGTATENNASSLSEIIPQSIKNNLESHDKAPKNLADLQDPRELRLKELESSLDYRFENKFRKQAEQELGKDLDIDKIDNALMSKTITSSEHSRITKEINSDYAKWFDAQRAKGNKEILDYDKDLAEYRKLHNDFSKELIEAKNKAENKQAHLQWLDSYKHQMIGKTDDEIIAAEIKKPKSTSKGKKEYFTYDEGKALLATTRKRLEKAFDLHPLSEFGTNYAEFYQDGKGAIAKLIAEANAAKEAGQDFSGQVAGAFSKEIDGAEASIDLVWGKITNAQTHEGYGLAHIIDKHPEITPQMLDEIIAQGKVESKNGVYTIILQKDGKDYKVGLSKGWDGKGDNEWIITAYKNNKGSAETSYHDTFTTKEPLENLDNEIIQKSALKIQEKMKVSKEYAENLAKWHKDSHPITKEADGTPKVFYHGNKVNDMSFEIFEPYYSPDTSKKAVFFSTDKSVAQTYTKKYRLDDKNIKKAKVFEVFLKIKNPLVIDFEGEKYAFVNQQKMADKIFKGEVYFDLAVDKALERGKHDGIIFKNIKDNRYGAGDKIADTFIVFDSNQIKAVGNKGTFDGTNPNIYHSSSTAGGGLAGGGIAGVERDDEGNIIGFSPERFALGFAAGASGAKAFSKIANAKSAQNLPNTITQNKASQNQAQNQASTKGITLSQKSIQKLATNPRAKAVMDKIKSKNDIMTNQKTTKGLNMQNASINFTTEKDQPISQIRNKAKTILNLLLNQKITNKNDGRIAIVSAQGRDKILSSEACKKSVSNGFSKEEHFTASEHIKELYENSKYIKSESAKNNSADIKHYHRYIADLEVNKKPAQALLTLKELIKDGNRIYSLELQEIRPLSQTQAHTKQAGQGQS